MNNTIITTEKLNKDLANIEKAIDWNRNQIANGARQSYHYNNILELNEHAYQIETELKSR